MYKIDKKIGLLTSLQASGCECLAGPLLRPLVVVDEGDAWGTELWSYRQVEGSFQAEGHPRIIENGSIRSIIETVLAYKKSRIVLHIVAYPLWPVLEFRLRVLWNEERKRLKLSIPMAFGPEQVLCEIPGGAIDRPADGREHVHGRWILAEGVSAGKQTALGVVNSGQYGFDLAGGEIRLSVLRSSAYCHERGLKLGKSPSPKFADLGVHDFKLLVTAGDPAEVRSWLPGLADWLSSAPIAFAHLPIGLGPESSTSPASASSIKGDNPNDSGPAAEGRAVPAARSHDLLSLRPPNIRMISCKQSWDNKALIVRLHEVSGIKTKAVLKVAKSRRINRPGIPIKLAFRPFEIKTIRIDKSAMWREVNIIEEI